MILWPYDLIILHIVSKRFDETNSMVPIPRLYLIPVKSYWQKCICDFDDVTWPTQRSPADNCQRSRSTIAPLSSSTAKGIITIKVKGCFDSKTRGYDAFVVIGPWYDLENKVISQDSKVTDTWNFQSTSRKDEEAAMPKIKALSLKAQRAAQKNCLGVATTPPPHVRARVNTDETFLLINASADPGTDMMLVIFAC